MSKYNINITSRRFGKLKQMMDTIEQYHNENPEAVVIGPSSPFNKYNIPIYDGSAIRRNHHDYDDPWFVPVEWIIANPEKYQELLKQKKEVMEALNKAFNIKMPEIEGKAIFTSLVDTGEAMYRTFWDNSDKSHQGLKRMFIPAYKKDIDKWGFEDNNK